MSDTTPSEPARYRQTLFHEVNVRGPDGWSWCRLLWDDGGRVVILSDYGCWSHWWGNRGEGVSVPAFLARVGMEYAGKKMLGEHSSEFDLDGTIRAAKTDVLHERRSENMTSEEAREEWEAIEAIGDEFEFHQWVVETRVGDAWENHRTRIPRAWTTFWEQLWVPCVVPELQRLLRAAPTIIRRAAACHA